MNRHQVPMFRSVLTGGLVLAVASACTPDAPFRAEARSRTSEVGASTSIHQQERMGHAPLGVRWRAIRASVESATFHRLNKFDWIGEAHNEGIDRLRRELRAEVGVGSLCTAIERAAIAEATVRSDARRIQLDPRRLRIAVNATLTKRGCTTATEIDPTAWRYNSLGVSTAQESPSQHALALLASIEGAVLNASSPGHLSTALIPVLDSATILGGVDEELVHASASIAVASYEYWEAEWEAAGADVDAEYGACILANEATMVDPITYCLTGQVIVPTGGHRNRRHDAIEYALGGLTVTHILHRSKLASSRLANSSDPCFIPGATVRSWVKTDFIGAVGGFFGGLWAGPGALSVGLATGISSSAAHFAWDYAVATYECNRPK